MTGAGSSTLAFTKEDGFMSEPDTPTYYLPGRNPTIDELSLSRTLERLRTPQNAEAVDSLAGNLEGAFGVTFAMSADTHEHVRDIVFNDGPGTGFTSGPINTSRWYVGAEHLDSPDSTSVVERVLQGTIPLEYTVTYEQGTNTIQESLTMGYADETTNTAITPSSITGPTDGNDVPFHGTELTVDSAVVDALQSATITISNISRFERGPSPTAIAATLAAPETSLDAAALYRSNDELEAAYGSSGSTSTQDTVDNRTAELAFDVDGTAVATYTLPKTKPDQYDWENVIDGENSLQDPTSYHVNGGVSVA